MTNLSPSRLAMHLCHKIAHKKACNKLAFKHHLAEVSRIAINKMCALTCIAPYMDEGKVKYLIRAFINCQFQYCPLVLIFHSRQLHHKINKVQERVLRVTYHHYESSVVALLEKGRSIIVDTNL